MRRASLSFHLRRGADAARHRRRDRDGFRSHGDGDDARPAAQLLRQRRARRRRVAAARMRVRRSHDRRQPRSRATTSASRSKARASGGELRVRVTTRTVVDEPIVAINVILGCNSQVSRRFVSFVDPPLVNLASAQESLPPQQIGNQVGPLLDIVRGADMSRQRSAGSAAAGASVAAESRRPSRRAAATGVRVAAAGAERAASDATRGVAADRGARRHRRRGGRAASARHAAPEARRRGAVHDAATAVDGHVALAPTPGAGVDPNRLQLLAAQAAASAAGAALVREQERLQSLEAGPDQVAQRRAGASSRRSARCRHACARPRTIATPTVWSIRSPPGCCSSPCWRPRSGPCGRASAGALAGSTPTPTRRGARPLPATQRHGRPDLVRHAPCAQGQPASFAMARGAGQHPAGDGTGVDRRPRGDHRARAAVAPGANGRGRRVGQQRRQREPGHVAVDGRADRPRAAGRVLRRPRPGRGGDRAARRAPARGRRRQSLAIPAAARDPPAARRSRQLRGSAPGVPAPLQGIRSGVELGPPLRSRSGRVSAGDRPPAGALADAAARDAVARQPALSAQRERRELRLPGLSRPAVPVLDRARARRQRRDRFRLDRSVPAAR